MKEHPRKAPAHRKQSGRRPGSRTARPVGSRTEDAADNLVCDQRESDKRFPIEKLFRKYRYELTD